jgi:hypothetical protein
MLYFCFCLLVVSALFHANDDAFKLIFYACFSCLCVYSAAIGGIEQLPPHADAEV